MSLDFFTLNNGLIVATDRFPYSNFVVIQIWVKIGSRTEGKINNGIAHFLEHMAFKGTELRNAEQIAIAFDDLGAVFNAHTGKENTVYYVKVIKECFDTAFEIISDIILNSNYDVKELEREKHVVLEEIAETNDDPSSLLFDKFIETVFPDQPLGRSILGTKETVNSFNRAMVLSFVDENYHAGNIFLIVSGDIEHQQIVEKSAKTFSSLKFGSDAVNQSAIYHDCSEYRESRDLEQMHLIFGVKGVDFYHSLYYPLHLVSIILGGSMSSRLFQEVREKRGLVYSISSFSLGYLDSGIFGIYACATPNNVVELIAVIAEELRKIKNNVVLSELNRAKNQLKSSLLMKMEGLMGRANYMGKCLQYHGKYIPLEELVLQIDSIDLVVLQSAIDELINFKNLNLGAIGNLDCLPDYGVIASMF